MLSLLWEVQELKIIKNKRGEKLLKTKSSLDTVTLSGIQSIQCLYLRNAAFIHLTAIFKSIYCSLTVQWLIAKVDTQSKLSLKSIINIFRLKSWEQVYIFKFVFLNEAFQQAIHLWTSKLFLLQLQSPEPYSRLRNSVAIEEG